MLTPIINNITRSAWKTQLLEKTSVAIVLQNNIYSHMWSNVAASLGSKEAREIREKISQSMTLEDISKAQELARRCIENNYKKCEQ